MAPARHWTWKSWHGDVSQEFYAPGGGYEKANPEWNIDDASWKARQVLKALERQIPRWATDGVSLADVGCGSGGVLHYVVEGLRVRGITVRRADGYDTSPSAIARARSRFPALRFYEADFLSIDRSYDCVLAMDVIEHVADPSMFAQGVARRGECIVYHVPFEDTWSVAIRNHYGILAHSIGHIHFFSPRSFRQLLLENGVTIDYWNYTPYFMQGLSRRKTARKLLLGLFRYVGMHVYVGLTAKVLGQFEMVFVCRSGLCRTKDRRIG